MIQRDSWDLNVVTIGGVPNPGRARVSGASRPYKWDIQEGRGQIGASTTLIAVQLAKFSVHIDMWTQEQLAAWEIWKKLLPPQTKPGVPGLGVTIGHPALADLGITEASLEEQGQLVRGDNGVWTVELKMLEYQKRKPMPPKKTRGAIPGAKGAPSTTQTEADKALAEGRAAAAKAKAAADG